MCQSCGCGLAGVDRHPPAPPAGAGGVDLFQDLLAANDAEAERNRTLFNHHGVLVVNLMSSPGSGKTSLLEATVDALGSELRLAVIEGDLATENDARRLRSRGVPAVQICTGNACHLDAPLVANVLPQLPLAQLDILFIENVGNLVCPAAFDLGHHCNVTLLSVPEGDDKPAKYPVMFRASDLLLISKCDLLPVFDDFAPPRVEQYLRALANPAPLLQVTTRDTVDIDAWLTWLRQQREQQRNRLQQGDCLRPRLQQDGARRRHVPVPTFYRAAPTSVRTP